MAVPFGFGFVDEDAVAAEAARDVAADRVRRAARSPRKEGLATKVPEVIGHIPMGMVGAAAGMVDAAREIAGEQTGTVPMLSTDYDPRRVGAGLTAETALNAMGMPGVMAGGPAASVGIFGGRLAQTADKAKLARAEDMAAKGRMPDEIWESTGWFQGVDGKWRFEIPDQAAKFNRVEGKHSIDNWPIDRPGQTSIGEAFNHPDLMAAYPDLKNLPLKFEDAGPFGSLAPLGSYRPADPLLKALDAPEGITVAARPDRYGINLKDARSITLHELSHAVQHREGFATGGNPANFKQQGDAELARDALAFRREMDRFPKGMDNHAKENAVIAEYQKLEAMDMLPSRAARDLAHDIHNNPNDQLSELVKLYGLDQKTTPHSPRELYRRQAGEVEARNVEHRADWDAQKRQDVPPVFSQDVPNADQIVRFGSLSPEAHLPMNEASRLDRALSQGFHMTPPGQPPRLFHETKGENIPGLESRGFDLNKVAARAGEDQLPDGVFLKREGRGIGLGGDGEAQIPLVTNAHKIREFADRDALSRFLSRDEKYQTITSEQKLLDQEYGKRFSDLEKVAWTREKTPQSEAAQKEIDALLKDWTDKGNEISTRARQRSTELLKAEGLEGVRVWNDTGSLGRKVDTTVIFDPARLRSPHAAFDPENVGKNMILGANAADRKTGAAASIPEFTKQWEERGVRNSVFDRPGRNEMHLDDVRVPKDKRGQGVGTEFMTDLTRLADEQGRTVTLTAAKDFGATSVARLKRFYKRFGFVENKGRNYDPTISGTMYRPANRKFGSLAPGGGDQ